MQSTLPRHSAVPHRTSITPNNNCANRIAAQRTQGPWGPTSVFSMWANVSSRGYSSCERVCKNYRTISPIRGGGRGFSTAGPQSRNLHMNVLSAGLREPFQSNMHIKRWWDPPTHGTPTKTMEPTPPPQKKKFDWTEPVEPNPPAQNSNPLILRIMHSSAWHCQTVCISSPLPEFASCPPTKHYTMIIEPTLTLLHASGTELEPESETGTIGTFLPGTETGTAGNGLISLE